MTPDDRFTGLEQLPPEDVAAVRSGMRRIGAIPARAPGRGRQFPVVAARQALKRIARVADETEVAEP